MDSVKEFIVLKINRDSIELKEIQSGDVFIMNGVFKDQLIIHELVEISIENIFELQNHNVITGVVRHSRLNPELPENSNLDIAAIVEGHYCFIYPSTWATAESKFRTAAALLERGKVEKSEELLFQILGATPDFVDAWNHLGVLAFRRSAWTVMLKYYKTAFQICRAKIPNDFTGELRWIMPTNQMFYRAVHGYALALIRSDQLENAVVLCEWLQNLDPSDYLGIGRLQLDLYLKLNQFAKIIQYFQSHSVANLDYYVLAFALFQNRAFEESARNLLKGIRYNPHLGLLLAGNAVVPTPDVKILPQGSFIEAVAYFNENRTAWQSARLLQDFLQQIIHFLQTTNNPEQLNPNSKDCIEIPDGKNNESLAWFSQQSDDQIGQIVASPALQQILSSISETDFKLM